MHFMHFAEITENVTFFAYFDSSKSILERFCRKSPSESLKYNKENKHFAMVRFLMFLTRTCIGDNGLSNLLDAICEPLVSGLNPVYVYKQKCSVSGRNHEVLQSWCPNGSKSLPEKLKT